MQGKVLCKELPGVDLAPSLVAEDAKVKDAEMRW